MRFHYILLNMLLYPLDIYFRIFVQKSKKIAWNELTTKSDTFSNLTFIDIRLRSNQSAVFTKFLFLFYGTSSPLYQIIFIILHLSTSNRNQSNRQYTSKFKKKKKF